MDETRIDTLTIEIGASSDEAVRQIDGVAGALRRLRGKTSHKIRVDTNDVDRAHKKVSALSKILSSLKRIAFYRVIRGAIKAVTQAFSEGLEAAYSFSKTISNIEDGGGRFAAAMDRMKIKANEMKGQLGSAFISLLAAVEPILIRLINLIIKVADAISQLLAAFTGKTYLKGIGSLVDDTKKGAKAAKEWRNQLLGFDEINRLNAPANGGGGGGVGSGVSFEDTPIDPRILAIVEKIKSAIAWIKDHIEIIKGIALGIGSAIAAWRIGSIVKGVSALGASWKTVLGIALAIGGAVMFTVGAFDAWKNGVDWDNMALMIGGVALAATGLGLAFGSVAAAIALIVGGIAMLVIGLKDWITTGELSAQTFWLLEAGIAAVGIGLAILVGWPALIVAAIAAMALAIYKYWDDIKAWWQTNVVSKFEEGLDDLRGDWQRTKDFFVGVWNSIKEKATSIFNAVRDAIVGAFETAKAKIKTVWDGIKSVIRGCINLIISAIEGWINSFISAINALLSGAAWVAQLFGGSFSAQLSYVTLPRYETGGFPEDGLFLANHNELIGRFSNGQTAVANNDQIVEGIRQGVYDAVTAAMSNGERDISVKVYLDSKQIKAGQERLARAWG